MTARHTLCGIHLLRAAALGLSIATGTMGSEVDTPIPRLRQTGTTTQLIVDGQPTLVLGGELGNSTASDPESLAAALDKCQELNLNAVLTPVYWDRIEPTEGRFDFRLVREAIDLARERDLRLALLWFGTWKNSMSCYAPAWVKRDAQRFPRARLASGDPLEIVSPACEAAREADAKAFRQLMRWLREYDSDDRTVVMVQVENEVGMIPEPRDHSDESEVAYRSLVPEMIVREAQESGLGPEIDAVWKEAGAKTSGSWAEVFGDKPAGQEVFTAWQLATYTETVARAGKQEYPLPLLVNAALVRAGYEPGRYPAGGPLPHLLELWRLGAPSVDLYCPDIYFPSFMDWCHRYRRGGSNPLFVPEMAPSRRAPANAVYAIARHGAIGCAPFAIEDLDREKSRSLADCYRMLRGLAPLVLHAQHNGTILGLSPEIGFDWNVRPGPERGALGSIVFEAQFDSPATAGATTKSTLPTLGSGRWDAPPETPLGAALLIQLGPEEYLVAGSGVTITFSPSDGRGRIGIESAREGSFVEGGEWVGGRWLNGDQTHQGRHVRLPTDRWTVQRVKLYRYE